MARSRVSRGPAPKSHFIFGWQKYKSRIYSASQSPKIILMAIPRLRSEIQRWLRPITNNSVLVDPLIANKLTHVSTCRCIRTFNLLERKILQELWMPINLCPRVGYFSCNLQRCGVYYFHWRGHPVYATCTYVCMKVDMT